MRDIIRAIQKRHAPLDAKTGTGDVKGGPPSRKHSVHVNGLSARGASLFENEDKINQRVALFAGIFYVFIIKLLVYLQKVLIISAPKRRASVTTAQTTCMRMCCALYFWVI